MSDYIVSRSFSLNPKVAACPPGQAIIALQAASKQLENALPRQQSVPAYEPQSPATAQTFDRHGK